MAASFRIDALCSQHDRKAFSSGVAALDTYFRQQASQDVRRRVTACYVATDAATGRIAGFYTLAAGGIPLRDIPDSLAKRLPRYPMVLVALLGRLAVDLSYRERKIGAMLLVDALLRSIRSDVAVFAVVVDAKDDVAEGFYRHHGFVSFGSLPCQLMLPLTNWPGAARIGRHQ